jgi:hypothetical protein
MKAAIFYSGQFRSFDKCYLNNVDNIFSKLDSYDVFLDIEMNDPQRGIEYIEQNVKFVKKYNVYSEKSSLIEGVKLKPLNLRGTMDIWLRQLKSIYDSYKLCEDIESYDIAFRMRTDSFFINQIEDMDYFDFNNIYIPNHDNWFGYNDRLYIGNIENMKKIFEFYNEIPNLGELVKYNAESYVKHYIDEYCKIPVKRTHLVGHTMREDGSKIEIFYN